MATLTRAGIYAELSRLNPAAPELALQRFAAHLHEYQRAQLNIDENGTIVVHPKSRQPVQNPYIQTRTRAEAAIVRILKDHALNTAGLWGEAPKAVEPKAKAKAAGPMLSAMSREDCLVRLLDDLEEDIAGMNSDVARVQGRAAIARHHAELSALREATAKAREEAERRKGGAFERIQDAMGKLEQKQLRQLRALIDSQLDRAPAH